MTPNQRQKASCERKAPRRLRERASWMHTEPMTLASAQAAIDRMEADEVFANRVKDAGSPEASIALLTSEGFDVTSSDMRDAALDRFGDQLTQEQLDALAAGVDAEVWVFIGGASVLVAAAAAV
jgi:predicted ribosomally synthesized peptide with nif11-like leader